MNAIFHLVVSFVTGLFSWVSRSSAAGGATVDVEMPGRDNTGGIGRGGGDADADRDRTAVQTAALGWTGYAITLAINLPKPVEPHLQVAYDAHVAFLCLTFFAAVYTLHYLFKEETEAAAAAAEGQRRARRKMMVLISVSAAIAFALRIYIAAASWWRVLLITAAASLLGLLYLRPDVTMIS